MVGVLRASGIEEIDWTKSPYQIEAAEPLPKVPWPYVVFMIPDSSTQHVMGANPWVETFNPVVWVVGTQKQRATILSPWVPGGVVPYLDSKRGTSTEPTGYRDFDCENAECIQFTRDSYRLGEDQSRSEKGQRIFVVESKYTLIYNL